MSEGLCGTARTLHVSRVNGCFFGFLTSSPTNHLEIVGARTVRVRLSDSREVPAQVVGADAATDMALLRVNAGHLPALRLGSSEKVSVGDVVIAIGDPFGLGFAIPAETVAAVIGEIDVHGRVDRGYLGVSAQALTPAIAMALGAPTPDGALITEFEPNGPADWTLLVGDVLIGIDSTPLTFTALPKIAVRLVPVNKVTVTFIRDGTQLSRLMTIGHLPDPPADPALTGGPDTWVPNLALGLANANAESRKALKADKEVGGLITYAGTKQLSRLTAAINCCLAAIDCR
jgi:serine protease Do